MNALGSKVKLAYRFYSSVIKRIEDNTVREFNVFKAINETHDELYTASGGVAFIVIPDDWNLHTHIKLAAAWLASQEHGVIIKRLNDLNYRVHDVLVIRRVIEGLIPEPKVNLEPYAPFIKAYGDSLVYAIDANVNTSMRNREIKCRHHPGECITNINIVADALVNALGNPWIHLMGPPPKLILSKFINKPTDTTGHTSNAIKSADTTGHRLDIVHYNTRQRGSGKMNDLLMRMRLKHYLSPTR